MTIDWGSIIHSLDWTQIVATSISAAVIGTFVSASNFLTTRYLGRFLDRIEKDVQPKKNGEEKKG